VDPHADPELDAIPEVVGGQGLLPLDRRGDGVVGLTKSAEERVSLGIDLHSGVRSERVAQEPPMGGEDVFVGVAEGMQEAREPSMSVKTRAKVPWGRSVIVPRGAEFSQTYALLGPCQSCPPDDT
jgi:hypothetical protein